MITLRVSNNINIFFDQIFDKGGIKVKWTWFLVFNQNYMLTQPYMHKNQNIWKTEKGMEQDDFEEGEILDSEEETDTTEVILRILL